MTNEQTLTPHPRLYIGAEDIARVRTTPALPYLKEAADVVAKRAAREVKLPPLDYVRDTHNEHLGRARSMQGRVMILLAGWEQTGREEFRRAVLKCIEQMGAWECWSWITWRRESSTASGSTRAGAS